METQKLEQKLEQKFEELNLDSKSKNAILTIIVLKTESEMSNVIEKLDSNLNSLKWFIGVITIVITLVRTLIKFLG